MSIGLVNKRLKYVGFKNGFKKVKFKSYFFGML